MEQNRPLLITTEAKDQLPILIVDKNGVIGNALTKVLRDQFLVVVVTAHEIEKHENVIHVPYHKKLPLIPDNAYSHIFLVYNGEKELVEMLTVFEEKAEATSAKLLFITSLRYSSQRLFDTIRRPKYPLLQTVLYGETFDDAIQEANEINFFIHQARVYGRVEVPKEGLGKLYPILLDDVITSLVSLAFAVERPKETIFLFPHHIITQVTLARIIQKLEPLTKVDFNKKRKESPEFYIPNHGLYFYRDYNLEDRLRRITLSRDRRRVKIPQKKIRLNIPNPDARNSRIKLLSIILVAVFIAPILLVLLIAFTGYGFLNLSLKQTEQFNIHSATSSAYIAQKAFSVDQTLAPSLVLPQLLIPNTNQEFVTSLQIGESVSETEISLLQSFQVMQNVYQGQSLDPKNDFLKSLATVKNALLTLQKLEAENMLPQGVTQKLTKVGGALSLIEGTIDTWPEILGFDNPKTYLFLFQNNMELRPGGGFIGSFGLLPIKNGKAAKLQIHDVYDADGQLTQHVDPPYGLRRYLGASNWFLRDSNFDPDFVRDGSYAQQFLQKEIGQKVDGVIAIDTTFLKELIGVVGSVDVPGYNQRVTPDNFYLLTQTHAEKNFFPGSTQKQDFLKSLTNALMNKLFVEKQIPYGKLITMLTDAVQQKHLLFSFNDSDVQNVFTVNDLSSSLKDARVSGKNTAFDYGGVVDANVGTNKANYYVKRSLSQFVSIDTLGSVHATASATYTNASAKTSPYGGDYKDYVQFLIPESATLDAVDIDGKNVQITAAITDPSIFMGEGFTPPPGLEVEQSVEFGKKVIGLFFIVPVGQTKTVSLAYSAPNAIDTRSPSFIYDLHVFKQPGTDNDPYQLFVAYPNTYTMVESDKRFANVGGKLSYSDQLLTDTDLMATFSKK
ncbi:MAG: DUF4012 domain-containing protein [Candidatus Levyibacteriota bacterium]